MLNTLNVNFMGILRLIPSGIGEGLAWGILALGVYISFRVLDVADMSVDGTLALGGVVTAVLVANGTNVVLAILISVISGAVAGAITGLMHTKLKIPAILSGILMMFALYSVNIHIMSGKSNVSLLKQPTLLNLLSDWLQIDRSVINIIVFALFAALVIAAIYWFFGTKLGSAIRATGCNLQMARAQGIDTDSKVIIGLAISNGLAALAGSLIAQKDSNATVDMASGAIVIGLASIVIGELIFKKNLPFWAKLAGVIVGSIIYRLIIMLALQMPFAETYDMKLITAILLVLAMSVTVIKKRHHKKEAKHA